MQLRKFQRSSMVLNEPYNQGTMQFLLKRYQIVATTDDESIEDEDVEEEVIASEDKVNAQ